MLRVCIEVQLDVFLAVELHGMGDLTGSEYLLLCVSQTRVHSATFDCIPVAPKWFVSSASKKMVM